MSETASVVAGGDTIYYKTFHENVCISVSYYWNDFATKNSLVKKLFLFPSSLIVSTLTSELIQVMKFNTVQNHKIDRFEQVARPCNVIFYSYVVGSHIYYPIEPPSGREQPRSETRLFKIFNWKIILRQYQPIFLISYTNLSRTIRSSPIKN